VITQMPPSVQATITAALQVAGYSLVSAQYDFDPKGHNSRKPETAPADLVAFWGAPLDQATSAIAARWLGNGEDRAPHLDRLREALWSPYLVIATPKLCEIWDLYPESSDASDGRPLLLVGDIPYDALRATIAENWRRLGRPAVEAKKKRWRQMAMWEMDPEPNAFLRWAYRPTQNGLTITLARVYAAATDEFKHELSDESIRWLLRMIGVRIAWDKRWLDPGSRTSPEAILADAKRYPTLASSPPPDAAILADIVANQLRTVHLGAVDGGLLSQLFQESSVSRRLQEEWKLYPTPQHVAWRMMATLPIETIPYEERRVWDGTCGSGTILVAALERLRALSPIAQQNDIGRYLVGAISGNDLALVLSDAARIALDLALGAPAPWHIGVQDVIALPESTPPQRPNIIVGNPPFQATGRTPDKAAAVLRRYINALPPGGFLSVVVPISLLATDSAAPVRRQLLEEIELYEVWQLPSKTFKGTQQETAVLMGRKPRKKNAQDSTVTWRFLASRGNPQRSSIDTLTQAIWEADPRAVIRPPLATRLESHLRSFPRLGTYVPESNHAQGITPGSEGKADIFPHPEPGAVPYLYGREDMLPFFIPWERHPHWIQLESARLHRARSEKGALFRSAKVLVTRLVTWGSAWRTRAAIETKSIYPSNQFIAIVPIPPLSMEFVAALFNSALANYLLGASNTSNTIAIQQMVQLPVPHDLHSAGVRRVEEIAAKLQTARQENNGVDRGDLALLTLELDAAVYEVFDIPATMRQEVAEYFLFVGSHRPGFDDPMVSISEPGPETQMDTIDEDDRRRMQHLFDTREERSLRNTEEEELQVLVDRWQRAYTQAAEQFNRHRLVKQPTNVADLVPG